MSEIPAGSRIRWFRLRLPGDCRDTQLWAERFLASQAAALDYYERRRAEHPTPAHPIPATTRRLGGLGGSRLMSLVPYTRRPTLSIR
jgi:hypothetical protein